MPTIPNYSIQINNSPTVTTTRTATYVKNNYLNALIYRTYNNDPVTPYGNTYTYTEPTAGTIPVQVYVSTAITPQPITNLGPWVGKSGSTVTGPLNLTLKLNSYYEYTDTTTELSPSFSISINANNIVVQTNSIPDHAIGYYPITPFLPDGVTPNPVYPYDSSDASFKYCYITYTFPRNPTIQSNVSPCTKLPMGWAFDNCAVYAPLDDGYNDPIGTHIVDVYQVHPEDVYGMGHRHAASPFIYSSNPVVDALSQQIKVIALMNDGFPLIRHFLKQDGTPVTNADLDECHGADMVRLSALTGVNYVANPLNFNLMDTLTNQVTTLSYNYVYISTYEFPYILTGFRGTPNVPFIACFTKDAEVLTPTGYIPIEKINRNDLILNPYGNSKRVINILKRTVFEWQDLPYLIKKDTFGENVPNKDINVSKSHKIKVNDRMITVKNLFRSKEYLNKIYINKHMHRPFVYYNLQIEDYDNMIVQNLEVESLDKNNNSVIDDSEKVEDDDN